MNKEKILETAKFLRTVDEKKFDMGHYCYQSFNCGTVACIAGWVYVNDHNATTAHQAERNVHDYAQAVFGLDKFDAEQLFMPTNIDCFWNEIKPWHAANVLEHLANTGEVDWSKKDG